MDGNNRRRFPDEMKGMQKPGKIEEVKKKIQSEEGVLAWDRQLCLGQWQGTGRDWRQPQEIQRGRKGTKRTRETPQGSGSVKLGKVAFSSASRAFG